MDLKPSGRSGDPVTNQRGSKAIGELDLNGVRNGDSVEQTRNDLNVANQDQVVKGSSIGDYQPDRLKS